MKSLANTASHNNSHDLGGGLELCSFVEQNLYTAVVSDSLDPSSSHEGISAAGTPAMQIRGLGQNDFLLGHLSHSGRSLRDRDRSSR